MARITRLGNLGEGHAESDDGPFFVPKTAPGDRVRHGPVERRGGVRRAPLLEVLEPGPTRRAPPCPRADRCGGCGLMHLTLPAQRAFKQGRVARALRVFGDVSPELVTGAAEAYRGRARLAWRGGTLGYRAARQRAVVAAPDCAVLREELAACLGPLAELPLAGEGEAHVALRDGRPVVQLRSDEAQPPSVYAGLEAAVAAGQLAGAELVVAGVAARFGTPEERRPGPDGAPLVAPLGGFAQAHAALEPQLARAVVAAAGARGRRVLELYAGHGLLTVGLAREASALRAVERDEAAARACRTNLAARGLDARVHAGDAAAALDESRRLDVLVVDPPRAGLADARAAVVAARVPRVVYLSCDPTTLAGDVRALAEAGYRLRDATAFDLFPHTPHVEALVVLEVPGPDC